MLDRRSHLRYHTKLVEVHMAFQMRGGTYECTPIMHEIKGSLELNSEKPIKCHDFILVPLVKHIIKALEVHNSEENHYL